ncbi:hypothetical protein HDV00_003897 [Rhizophlyctis rosea]|nr:hypothetical protein HDV00_003897 [Rhizophlyctis rosea]
MDASVPTLAPNPNLPTVTTTKRTTQTSTTTTSSSAAVTSSTSAGSTNSQQQQNQQDSASFGSSLDETSYRATGLGACFGIIAATSVLSLIWMMHGVWPSQIRAEELRLMEEQRKKRLLPTARI